MINFVKNLLFPVLGLLVLPGQVAAQSAAQPSWASPLVPSINGFSHDFFHELGRQGATENRVISGPSVHMALSVAYLGSGTRGATQNELAKALYYPSEMEQKRVAEAYSDLISRATSSDQQNQNGLDVHFANKILASNEFTANPSFNEWLEYFNTSVDFADFIQDPRTVLSQINGWVSQQTRGKITSILKDLDPTDKMVLLSAIYFNGSWKMPFEKPSLQPFYTDSSKSVCLRQEVPLMEKTEKLFYYEDDTQQVIEMPYARSAVGPRSSWNFYAVLPKSGTSIADLENTLSPAVFGGIVTKMENKQRQIVHVTLPKFKVEREYELNSILQSLGIEEAFTENADFSKMLIKQRSVRRFGGPSVCCFGPEEVPLAISTVKNKVYLDFTEKGTEAASVVAITFRTTAHVVQPLPEPIEFRADHPFFFMIRDKDSGLVLFQGLIVNP